MNGSDAVAQALLRVLKDPNVRFPIKPQLAPDLHVFHMPDGVGVQFHGTETPVFIRGQHAEAALTSLLPLLDGSHTLDDLIKLFPEHLSQATLLRTLSLLHTKGLLVEADPTAVERMPEPLAERGDDLASQDLTLQRQLLFWGRHLNVTRNARSAAEVQRRLARSRLVLVGTGLFGIATFDVLIRSGCQDIRILDWDDDGFLLKTLADGIITPRQAIHLSTTSVDEAAAWLSTWVEDVDLLVTATRNAPNALFRAINRISLHRECPWIRGNLDGTQMEVGPYVRPYESACYTCMELRQASTQDFAIEEYLYQQELARERPAGEGVLIGESLFAATLAGSLITAEVIRIITNIAPPTLLDNVLTILTLSGGFQTNRILRVPRCPDCFRGAIALLSELKDRA